MSVVGFDIGNETCYIAVARAGVIEVIDNEYSLRATPSFVGFTEKCRDIGISARTKLVQNIRNTVFGFKTILGKKYNDAIKDLSHLPFDVCELPSLHLGIKVKYLNEEVVFSVQQVMAMLLTKLKTVAELKLGVNVRECVISVPMFYTNIQRRAMLDAAEIAGLKPLKLINEPTAAALFYGFYRQNLFEEPKIAVFVDLGQSALTVTACLLSKDKLKILGSVWNTCVGGRDFDCVLVKHFVEEFRDRYKLDVITNKKALMLLILECESLKKQMSMNTRDLELNIECFMNEIDVCGKMKRELFEKLSSHLFQNIEETMRNLLVQTGLEPEVIHQVHLIGGSCRIPAVKKIIQKVFGQEPLATLNLDETVARGCALQCAFLSPTLKTKDFSIEDIQPFGIKVRSKPEDEIEVFPRFHKVPACKLVTFVFTSEFSLEAFYSDPSMTTLEIGKFCFSDIPSEVNEASDVRIKMKISVDGHGILDVGSATIVTKQKDMSDGNASKLALAVPSESNDALAVLNEDTSESPSEDQSHLKPREIIKSFDLNIKSFLPNNLRSDLNIFREKERDMINVDLHEKKMADLRNVVEEYVYGARGKLSNELKDFVTDDKRSNLFSVLDEVETWLYECKNLQEDEYRSKLDELKQLFEPVLKRYYDFENVTSALQEFQKVLHESSMTISALSQEEKYVHIERTDIEQLECIWREKKEYFNRCLSLLNRFNKCDEFPVRASIILDIVEAFQQKINSVISKPDPKSSEQDEFSAGGDSSGEQKDSPEMPSNCECPAASSTTVDGEKVPES